MIVNKSNGEANRVLANFPFVPIPPRSPKLISVSQVVKASKLMKRSKAKSKPNTLLKPSITRPLHLEERIQSLIPRLHISNPINFNEPATQISQVNVRAENRNSECPMNSQSYYRSNDVDPCKNVLPSLDDRKQKYDE